MKILTWLRSIYIYYTKLQLYFRVKGNTVTEGGSGRREAQLNTYNRESVPLVHEGASSHQGAWT
jgi:hypothetical protein